MAGAEPTAAAVADRLRAAISETGGSLGGLLRDALREIEDLGREKNEWEADAMAGAEREGAANWRAIHAEREREALREARAALLATVEAVVGEAVARERDRWAAAARASRESIRSLRRTAGLDARDWGAVSSDAWLYGVLLGWGSALPEIAERHGWNAETCARMEALRASLGRTPDSHVMAARPHDAEGR